MKIQSSLFYVLLPLLILSSLATGYTYHKSKVHANLEEVVVWNSASIHALGIVAATESHNAELLIQILNALEGRPVKDVPKEIDLSLFEDVKPNEKLPPTFEQVNQDQMEIESSIRALSGSNLFQAETLHNILNRLK